MATLSNISVEPIGTDLVVTLQEAKDYLGVDFPLRDDEIQRAIVTATQSLQEFTGMAFLPSNVSFYAHMEKGTEYFILPYSNGASGDNIKGNRYYTSESGQIEYTCGETEEWMKEAVLKYVADMFIHRGEEGFDSGREAKIFCAPYISHGGWF